MLTIAALITSHNRRESTLGCLRGLFASLPESAHLDVFLTDDGSSDGTGTAVRNEFPQVKVLEADGTLYWCRGMERAWREALGGHYDGYLWVNDDVVLDEDALSRFLSVADASSVLVGSLRDPRTGTATYGGYRRSSSWHPARLDFIDPHPSSLTTIDTFNGNLVYVPSAVVDEIGIIDPVFEHATGDTDYGLRARKAGLDVMLAPGTFGCCQRNDPTVMDIRAIFGRKGLPLRSWLAFTNRHAALWARPFVFSAPYVKAAARSLRAIPSRRRSPS